MTTNTPNKQVAIVTGAFSGIGLGITRALMQHGLSCGRQLTQYQQIKRFETLTRPYSCGREHRHVNAK